MQKGRIWIIIWLCALYFLLKNYIPYGNLALYPVKLVVTFFHEFGHALSAILTGGNVISVTVNSDGSGLAMTAGGVRPIVLMGGYVGSAAFATLLFYLSHQSNEVSKITLSGISLLMVFCAIYWYGSFFSFIILLGLAWALGYLAYVSKWHEIILQFLAIASLAIIVEDFRVGPSSDLEKFADFFIFIPTFVWMYTWLAIVVSIAWYGIYISTKETSHT